MLQWQSRWESDASVLEFFAIGRMTQAFLSRSVKGGRTEVGMKGYSISFSHGINVAYGKVVYLWKIIIVKGVGYSGEW